jgi:hypothetical protein
MKMHGLVPNFYIPAISPQTQNSKIGEPIMGIYKLLT